MGNNNDREYLMSLSEAEITFLTRISKRMHSVEMSFNEEVLRQEESKSLVLPEDAMKRYERLRQTRYIHERNDRMWFEYTDTLLKCKYHKPFLQGSDKVIYSELKQKCLQRHMPLEFAHSVLPLILNYVRFGKVKPLLFSGVPGTGKTTAGKILAELLDLPYYIINTNAADTGHNLFGESGSFCSPDIGEIARGIINKGLNTVFIIDEVEKAPSPETRNALQDELLSVLDGSSSTIRDNFLQYNIPIENSIFILTGNDSDRMNSPLRDRCVEVKFNAPDLARLTAITTEYASKKNEELYSNMFNITYDALSNAVNSMYDSGVSSIRKYEELVDRTLSSAYGFYLESDENGQIDITEELLNETLGQILDSKGTRIGFIQ